jgi:predicted nucleotidyltransferase
MRQPTTLDVLFTKTRQEILAATLLQPERWWYLSELAHFLNATPSSLQRELASLSEAGILELRTDGNRVYYRANGLCPFLPELQGLFVKTVGLVDLLARTLTPLAKMIDVAFVFGSFAESRELVTSDIDLLIVGKTGLTQIAQVLQEAENKMNRPINPVILSREEARSKLIEKNHFLETVRKANKLFILGKDSELGKAFSS